MGSRITPKLLSKATAPFTKKPKTAAAVGTGAALAGGLGYSALNDSETQSVPQTQEQQEQGLPLASSTRSGSGTLTEEIGAATKEVKPASYEPVLPKKVTDNSFKTYEKELSDIFKTRGEKTSAAEKAFSAEYNTISDALSQVREDYKAGIKEAKTAADKQRVYTQAAQLAETFGQALTQLAAARTGLATGVDMSGLKFNKADWAANFKDITDRLSEQKEVLGTVAALDSKTQEEKLGRAETTRRGKLSEVETESGLAASLAKDRLGSTRSQTAEEQRRQEKIAELKTEASKFTAGSQQRLTEAEMDAERTRIAAREGTGASRIQAAKALAGLKEDEAKGLEKELGQLPKLKSKDRAVALQGFASKLEEAGVPKEEIYEKKFFGSGLSDDVDEAKVLQQMNRLVSKRRKEAEALLREPAPQQQTREPTAASAELPGIAKEKVQEKSSAVSTTGILSVDAFNKLSPAGKEKARELGKAPKGM